MAMRELQVATVDGMVRLTLPDGSHVDFLPGEANKLAGLILRASHEAVYNEKPKSMTLNFNFEN